MKKKILEPEEIMRRKMNRMKIDQGDIYDVLGHLIREFSLAEVADQLATYLGDQTEQAFNQVEFGDGGLGMEGLPKARAFDVCFAWAETLSVKAKEYEL